MGWINTINYTGRNTLLKYRTDGHLYLIFKDKEGNQFFYETHMDKDQYEGQEYIEKKIRSYRAWFNDNPEKWMKCVGTNWKRMA